MPRKMHATAEVVSSKSEAGKSDWKTRALRKVGLSAADVQSAAETLKKESETIGTREMADILEISQRRAQAICDEGILREGTDWWRLPSTSHNHKSNGQRGGNYRIKRASAFKLKAMQ